MQNFKRRKVIKSGVKYSAIVALGSAHLSSKAGQRNGARDDISMGVNELTATLRAMDNEVCNTAAENLEKSLNTGASLYVHLRNAGLELPVFWAHNTAQSVPQRFSPLRDVQPVCDKRFSNWYLDHV